MAALYQQIADFLDRIETTPHPAPSTYLQCIPVRKGHRVSFIDVSAID